MTDQLPTVHKPQLTGGGAVVALVPQTLDEAYRLADAMSRSGLTPYNIKTPEAVMVCIMAGAELGFPPFQSLQSFAVIQGRPSIYGDAVPALLWSKGFDIDETFEGDDPSYPDTMKAICTVTRPNGKKVTRTFTVAEAKTAKLWGKKSNDGKDTPWITNPKRMIQMRARGFAARDGASDIMRGLPLYEEAMDFQPIREVETPVGTGMKERLSARPAEVDAPGFNVRTIAAETGQNLDEVLEGDNIPQEGGKRKRRTKAEMAAARAAEAAPAPDAAQSEPEAATPASDDGTEDGSPPTGDDTGPVEPETVGENLPDSEGEPDGSMDGGEQEVVNDDVGESSQPTSDASPDLDELPSLTPEESAYSAALEAALTFEGAKDALVAFRRTEMFRGATPADQTAWQIMCYERTQVMRQEGIAVPSPHLNPWYFSLWLSWAKDNAKDQIPKIFAALQKTPAYQVLNEAQQGGLVAGVEAALAP